MSQWETKHSMWKSALEKKTQIDKINVTYKYTSSKKSSNEKTSVIFLFLQVNVR